ncbi:hypothetical protein ACFLZB_01655 [Nanoarchaeota archaeon]
MKSKKGQMRMMETMAILFVFFVLLLFGIIFYYQFQKSSIEDQRAQILSEKSIDISLRASFLPELICPGVPTKKDCIDITKMEIFSEKAQEEYLDYYYDILQSARITVEELYPPSSRSWVLYDQQKPNATRSINTPVPVSLFDPETEEHSFGVLKIEVYS